MIEKEQIVIQRNSISDKTLDIGGRDLLIGFSEPSLKKSDKCVERGDLDSKLNARLPSYFLPAVQIAQMQSKRPRLIIVSGVLASIKWNAQSDREKRMMLANYNLKAEFLKSFFDKFFKNVFSLVEFRISYDFLKISDKELDTTWSMLNDKYPEQVFGLKTKLLQFRHPKLFSSVVPGKDDLEHLFVEYSEDMRDAFRYALIHLFAMGDVNIGWDFSHNKNGYCSIGEHNEQVFNVVREIGKEVLKDVLEKTLDQEVYSFENKKIVIDDVERMPPAYNGATRTVNGKEEFDEVTYENERSLSYYSDRERLAPIMDNLYTIVPMKDYESFWNKFCPIYLDLKSRYAEAYGFDW